MKPKILYKRKICFTNLCEFFDCAFSKYSSKIYCKYIKDGQVFSRSYCDLYENMKRYGSEISGCNISAPHIAAIGKTDFEWVSVYFSSLYYGFVFIPLDRLLPKEELLRQVDYADVDLLMYGDEYKEIAEYIFDNSSICKKIIPLSEKECSSWINEPSLPKYNKNQLVEIVFTSGTTGLGKAVMLSHENILKTLMYGIQLVKQKPEDTVLSIMPNNHTYELTIGLLMPVYFGMTVAIYDNVIKRLFQNMQIFRPVTVLVVPMLLDGIYNKIILELEKDKKKKKYFYKSVQLNKVLRKFGINLAPVLFKQIYQIFGGNIQYLICGGAFLRKEIIDFFDGIGLKILEGYGLTECAPIVSCNSKRYVKKGSLGKIGPFCHVKIESGEIWVKGDNVMLGYYKDPISTSLVFEGEWFKTGDLGKVENGFLYMNGRKKNLIIMSNGENVNPEKIENMIEQIELVDTVVVYSNFDTIVAEIYPDYAVVQKKKIVDVQAALEEKVNEINVTLPMYMQVRKIIERNIPFEKTTTLKVKRNTVVTAV